MNKKAISPIIATVLIIGFFLIALALILNFGGRLFDLKICNDEGGEWIDGGCAYSEIQEQQIVTECISGDWDEDLKECVEEKNTNLPYSKNILYGTCNGLIDEFKNSKSYDYDILLINLMILKDCEIEREKEYTGKCASQLRHFDEYFEKGNMIKAEDALRELKKCREENAK